MPATRKLVPLVLGLTACVAWILAWSVDGPAAPAVAGPETPRDAAEPVGAAVDAAASQRLPMVRDSGEESRVRVLDRETRAGLEHAWLVGRSPAHTLAAGRGGEFVLPADRAGAVCTAGSPGENRGRPPRDVPERFRAES